MGIEEECLGRVSPSAQRERERAKGKGKKNKINTTNTTNIANNSSSLDLELYGTPIKFIERIAIVFGFLAILYLMYASKVFFTEFTILAIGRSIFGVVVFIIMAVCVLKRRSSLDIIAENIESFREQFAFKKDDKKDVKKITANNQIAFLMKLTMDIIKDWNVSWTVYTIVIMIFYIIFCWIGLFLTVLLLLIILICVWLKSPEISESFKKYLKSKTREIPAKPPSVGVMTIFGNPMFDLILDAGTAIVYPGIIDFLPVEVHQEPEDFEEISGLFAKGDSENDDKGNIPVTVKELQTLYVPELSELKYFVSAKEQSGVRDALKNMIASELRKILSGHSFDELIGGKDAAGKRIIEKIEDKLIEHLTGTLVDKDSRAAIAKAEAEIAKAKADMVTGVDIAKAEAAKVEAEAVKAKVEAEIAKAKADMAKNGRSDVHLLGIKVHRISISSIETSDAYLQEMVKAAAEDKQRIAERKDSETEKIQADIYYEAYKKVGEPKSWNHCLQMVMDNKSVREGYPVVPGKREFFESADIQKIAGTILEIIREMKKK